MQNIFSHFIKIYLSKLLAIVYIDSDLDPDLDTTHGYRSSPIPKIVQRSTSLQIPYFTEISPGLDVTPVSNKRWVKSDLNYGNALIYVFNITPVSK